MFWYRLVCASFGLLWAINLCPLAKALDPPRHHGPGLGFIVVMFIFIGCFITWLFFLPILLEQRRSRALVWMTAVTGGVAGFPVMMALEFWPLVEDSWKESVRTWKES